MNFTSGYTAGYTADYERLFFVQRRVASRASLADGYTTEAVAGVDQAFLEDLVISGAVMATPSGTDRSSAVSKALFPYVSGLLFFREGPAAARAVRGLGSRPTLLFVDGCGVNHPRGAGMATILGVLLDVPTVGVTKNPMCGEFMTPGGVGEASPLVWKGRVVGHVLKSQRGCRPIVVAPGHRVSVDSSLELARKYTRGHKLPEPCFLAHQYANAVKREMEIESRRGTRPPGSKARGGGV